MTENREVNAGKYRPLLRSSAAVSSTQELIGLNQAQMARDTEIFKIKSTHPTHFGSLIARFISVISIALPIAFGSMLAMVYAVLLTLPSMAQAQLQQTYIFTQAFNLGSAGHIDDLGMIEGQRHLVIQQSGEIRIVAVTALGFALRARITNPLSGDWGHMLTVVPDVNGDGVNDIATYGRDSQITGDNTFYMLSGNQMPGSVVDGDTAAIYTIGFGNALPRYASVKPSSSELLLTEFSDIARRRNAVNGAILHTVTGSSIANGGVWVGDFDGDSVPDYLTGGRSFSSVAPLYVISGADTTDGSAASRAILTLSDAATPGLGYAEDHNNIAAAIGDINGDGISEIAVGSRLYRIEPDGTNYGRVVVFDGSTGSVVYRLEPDQTHTNGVYFGNNIVATGDMNGDGIGDFIVSARGYSQTPGGFGDGAIIAYSGLDGTEIFRLFGSGNGIGDYEITKIADLNADGIADLAVGSLSDASIWLSSITPTVLQADVFGFSQDSAPQDGIPDNVATGSIVAVSNRGPQGFQNRGLAEFDISSLSAPVLSAELGLTKTYRNVTGIHNFEVIGYVGNGTAELSDYNPAGGISLGSFEHFDEETEEIDVTAFVNSLITASDQFAGFQILWSDAPSEDEFVIFGATFVAGSLPILTVNLVIDADPVADAGPDQSIRAGDTVFLDGRGSFDDNTATVDLDYQWSITGKPMGSAATLDFPTSDMPSFVADLVGTYDVELVVTDEEGASSPADPVQIGTGNLAPTSDAGADKLVIIGDPVFLDGSGSTDPDGDLLTFAWAITSAPVGSLATLSGSNTEFPSFVPDFEDSYVVTLTVSDFIGPGAPNSVEITAATGEEFAEIQIVDASEEIASIPPEEVTTVGNQTAFTKFLQQAMTAILEDDIETAIDKLEKSIIRTDGCVLRGSPDLNGKGRDWITDCAAQTEAYDLLTSALDALTQP